ncbi:MAG: hypothetical protein GVY29_08865, partial [Spirochaetes bacterium]|nr:hypothetical protein [Spirochaetota bacterium]
MPGTHDQRNVLELLDLEPPMGDLFSKVALGRCQSVWTSPLPHEHEGGAPQKRIIHSVSFRPHGPATLRRLGYQSAQG